MLFLFFFQAEDGIRDYKVTGVQTCALPISRRRAPPRSASGPGRGGARRRGPPDVRPTDGAVAGRGEGSDRTGADDLRVSEPPGRAGGPAGVLQSSAVDLGLRGQRTDHAPRVEDVNALAV